MNGLRSVALKTRGPTCRSILLAEDMESEDPLDEHNLSKYYLAEEFGDDNVSEQLWTAKWIGNLGNSLTDNPNR